MSRKGWIWTGAAFIPTNLLMAALDGAVALKEIYGVAMAVGKNLDLHMPRAFDVALDKHVVVVERLINREAPS
jgi:hypothetical protein